MGHVERHAVQRHNQMICFDDGADRFQMRAAGLAIRDGRVLVQNMVGDRLASIPGGRIDQNESSVETVIREIEEEFSRTVEVGPLHFVIERFFPDGDRIFHEVGFYYGMTVPADFPYHETDVCHRFQEGPVQMEYRWVPATIEGLAAVMLTPLSLRTRLADALPSSTVHIIDHEAR